MWERGLERQVGGKITRPNIRVSEIKQAVRDYQDNWVLTGSIATIGGLASIQ